MPIERKSDDFFKKACAREVERFNNVRWCGISNLKTILSNWIDNDTSKDRSKYYRLKELGQFYAWTVEHLGLANCPQRQHLLEFYDYKRAQGFRSTSLRKMHNSVGLFFTMLDNLELYPNIAQNISIDGATEYRERPSLTADQVRRLIDQTTDARMRAILSLMAFCGLRCVEITELNWGDISGDRATVRGKGRKEKAEIIALPVCVQTALNDWKKLTTGALDDDAPVFVHNSRHRDTIRLEDRYVSSITSKYLKACFPNIKGISAHCLRHTAITIAIESGVEITRVSRFARHRNLNTTMVYIHDNKRFSDPVAGYVEAAVNGERTSKDEEAIEKIVRNVLRRLLKL